MTYSFASNIMIQDVNFINAISEWISNIPYPSFKQIITNDISSFSSMILFLREVIYDGSYNSNLNDTEARIDSNSALLLYSILLLFILACQNDRYPKTNDLNLHEFKNNGRIPMRFRKGMRCLLKLPLLDRMKIKELLMSLQTNLQNNSITTDGININGILNNNTDHERYMEYHSNLGYTRQLRWLLLKQPTRMNNEAYQLLNEQETEISTICDSIRTLDLKVEVKNRLFSLLNKKTVEISSDYDQLKTYYKGLQLFIRRLDQLFELYQSTIHIPFPILKTDNDIIDSSNVVNPFGRINNKSMEHLKSDDISPLTAYSDEDMFDNKSITTESSGTPTSITAAESRSRINDCIIQMNEKSIIVNEKENETTKIHIKDKLINYDNLEVFIKEQKSLLSFTQTRNNWSKEEIKAVSKELSLFKCAVGRMVWEREKAVNLQN